MSLYVFSITPVEHFMILPIFPLYTLISFNNVFVLIFVTILFISINLFILFQKSGLSHFCSSCIIHTRFQIILEYAYKSTTFLKFFLLYLRHLSAPVVLLLVFFVFTQLIDISISICLNAPFVSL